MQPDRPRQRAHVNRPELDAPHPPVEKAETSRSTSAERHSGHSRSWSACAMRRSISNCSPHFWQRYSYMGMAGCGSSHFKMQCGAKGDNDGGVSRSEWNCIWFVRCGGPTR